MSSNYNYAFSNGILLRPGGLRDEPAQIIERESSNGLTVYTAILWKHENVASCNCPGWANRRTCKHVKELMETSESSFVDRTDVRRRLTPEVVVAVRQFRGLDFEETPNFD